MSSIRFLLFACFFDFLILSLPVASASDFQKPITIDGKKWTVLFEIVPSNKNGNGLGHCGAGQEVTLKFNASSSKKIVFSKLIESCLESIEIEGGELGNETAASLSRAIKLDKNPIEIRWINFKGKGGIVGKINLSSGTATYSESVITP